MERAMGRPTGRVYSSINCVLLIPTVEILSIMSVSIMSTVCDDYFGPRIGRACMTRGAWIRQLLWRGGWRGAKKRPKRRSPNVELG
jgi:hypothetical protein